jgi:hypothetical protein
MLDEFPSLTSRLAFIELCADRLKNIEVWICLSEFEKYAYGVTSQYKRIIDNLPENSDYHTSSFSLTQLSLDIYYYTLTWDKLRKVFGKLKEQLNTILKIQNSLSGEFISEFKQLRIRMEHFFGYFRTTVRNEYEHPSLKPSQIGNFVASGNLIRDVQGNIKTHIGGEEFAIVRKEHIDKLHSFWVELIDTFVKHFTDNPPSSELLLLKKQIEENIDEIIEEYMECQRDKRDEDSSQILHQILMAEIYLSKEGIPLRQDVQQKIYSNLLQGRLS